MALILIVLLLILLFSSAGLFIHPLFWLVAVGILLAVAIAQKM
jgi:hypothetical protein